MEKIIILKRTLTSLKEDVYKRQTVMNMGNYAHGNQPIQHMIYLYDYAGQPWKAQYWLRQVMDLSLIHI